MVSARYRKYRNIKDADNCQKLVAFDVPSCVGGESQEKIKRSFVAKGKIYKLKDGCFRYWMLLFLFGGHSRWKSKSGEH